MQAHVSTAFSRTVQALSSWALPSIAPTLSVLQLVPGVFRTPESLQPCKGKDLRKCIGKAC